jgi:predicted enzyme related to lactoylglutathione lyase
LFLLVSCASKVIIVPPVVEKASGVYYPGKFVWHDLITDDVPAVKKFYSELFGWEYESTEEGENATYTIIKLKGKSIGGIIFDKRDKKAVSEAQWVSYLSVPEVDKATDYFRNNGGTVHRETWDINNRGRVSVVSDPQGAFLVLIKTIGGDPEDAEPQNNSWLWNEFFASDPEEAVSFYEKLVVYDHEKTEITEDYNYYVLNKNKTARAGVLKNPWEKVRPNWLPYIKVEDPNTLVTKTEELGGRVIFKPKENVRKGSVAIISDPTGAAVAIQKWPFE